MTFPGAGLHFPVRFVGIDLETTGLDSEVDRIIEVGAVRVVEGEMEAAFESLVNPGVPIPDDVTYLTGISDDDVRDAPPIGDVLPKLLEFLGGDPMVAHSAPFDAAFIEKAILDLNLTPERGFAAGSGAVYDTLPLARALLPRLTDHRLVTVAGFLDVSLERSHRAGDDARAVALALLEMFRVLRTLGPALLADMARLADPDTRRLIEAAKESAEPTVEPRRTPDFGSKSSRLLRYDNIRRIDAARVPLEETKPIDLDEMEGLFEKGGPIASTIPHYEPRAEQLAMLKAVADSLVSGVHLVVEAGTGVGKSLAYLVPAIYWAVENGVRVVISTRTKNLQDQLFFKDIPLLEKALEPQFSAALLKGRGNYLCLNRWRQILAGGLSPDERAQLLPVVVWEEETNSGDISENSGFRQRGYIWSRISSDGGPCEGSKCPMSDRCYLMKARRAALTAHIVVDNHSLLFSDTETDNRILGDYSYLICDEAHNIESVATEHLGRRASVWRARAILDNLYRKDGAETGVVSDVLAGLGNAGEEGLASTIRTAAERLRHEVEAARRATAAFFRELAERHPELSDGRPIEFGKMRYRDDFPVAGILEEELKDALTSLVSASECATSLADLVADSELPRADAVFQNLEYSASRLVDMAADLKFLAEATDRNSVYWLSAWTGRTGVEFELRSAPVSITEMMGDFLYSRVESLVLTSATMTVDSSFGFMMERLGLDLLPDWKVVTLAVGSPYDYSAQTLAVVAGYLPPPSSPGFNRLVGDLLLKLAQPAEGGTLALFTSRAALESVFKAVRGPLMSRGKRVLAQGHSGGSSALLTQFEQDVDSVLLATTSFWEGVDVRGRSLEQLIIAKLPFPVPKDPIVEAHCERYEAEGEASFERYMVPLTAIRLRQGFGRLIRSTTDRGVVVFLDSRLVSRRYGQRLLEQLPTETIVANSEGELLGVVGAAEPLGRL